MSGSTFLGRIGAFLRRTRGRLAMRYGRASSLRPLSEDFGFSRGTPIDRWYIESFLHDRSEDIRGHVLEVGDASYSRRFGGERITKQEVLHVSAGNPHATIVGDLSKSGLLPAHAFDCIIFTQTLHLIFDIPAAIAALHQTLRPGGVLLITVPGITPIDRGEWKHSWYWSLTEAALTRLLGSRFDAGEVTTQTYGNLFAATAFLHGASLEETGIRRLGPGDPSYPVIVAARARRS